MVRQTNRQTDGRHHDANSRSYCVAVRSAKNIILFLSNFPANKTVIIIHNENNLRNFSEPEKSIASRCLLIVAIYGIILLPYAGHALFNVTVNRSRFVRGYFHSG